MPHRKQLIAIAALTLCNCVSAQVYTGAPSLQLYGTVDLGIYNKQLAGESKVHSMGSGGLTTSRWGIAGTEDLGGGMRAVFDLSSFIRADTGEAGRSAADPYFGRFSWVGLASDNWGLVRAGRIATATFVSEITFGAFQDSTTLGPYLLHTFVASATQPMITGNGTLDSAWNNSVSYTLPALASIPGLNASVQVAANENSGAGRRVGGGVTYRNDVYGTTFTVDDTKQAAIAAGAPTAGLATLARPLYTASDVRTYQGGAYYDFKVARLWAQAARSTLQNATVNEIRLKTYALSATVPLDVSNILLEWAHTDKRTTALADQSRDTVAVGYSYLLSKRTDLYAVLMRDRVSGLSSGTGVTVGVRHRF